MKLNFILFFLPYFCIFCCPKNYYQWEGIKKTIMVQKKLIYPFFTNHNYLVDNNSVYVSLSYKTDNQVVLDQLQWQELSLKGY
jgi:hypothetical protein